METRNKIIRHFCINGIVHPVSKIYQQQAQYNKCKLFEQIALCVLLLYL